MLYRIKMNLTFEKYKVYGEFYQTQITKYTKKSKRLAKSFLVDGCIALLFAWLLKNMILVILAILLFLSTPFFLVLYKKEEKKKLEVAGIQINHCMKELKLRLNSMKITLSRVPSMEQ